MSGAQNDPSVPAKTGKWNLPRAVYWIAALAFALRIAARLWYTGIDGFWQTGYGFYFDLAQGIAKDHVFGLGGSPTAYRVPLYSAFLAAITLGERNFWAIEIAQSLIGAGIAIVAALLALRMFRGAEAKRAAMLAAAVVAVYPYFVIHDTAMQETSLFTLLTALVVLALYRAVETKSIADGALAGLLLGLDVLTRATILPFAVLAPVWLFWRRGMRASVACTLLLAATVSPWLARNAIEFGAPVLSTDAGTELWTAQCGFLFRHYPQESVDISQSEDWALLTAQDNKELAALGNDDVATDHWFLRKGMGCALSHPGQTVVDGFRKNLAGFGWLPSPRRGWGNDLVNACTYGPVMLLGLWGMGMRRGHWREDSLIYLLFGAFIFTTAVFWAHTSHRVYLDLYWIVFGAGVVAGWRKPGGGNREEKAG